MLLARAGKPWLHISRGLLAWKNTSRFFETCPKHFCFAREDQHNCTSCGKARPEGVNAAKKVRYIPVLPRITAMASDSCTRQDLYSCWCERSRDAGYFNDYFDGQAFKDLCGCHGGEDKLKFDVFLGVSTDVLQAFKYNSCGVWPLFAFLLNLHPSQRYAAKNVLPLLFTEDGSQPKDVQSFLVPLTDEVHRSHKQDGFPIYLDTGENINVRIHIAWVSADLDALMKIAGLSGHNARFPCRYCLIQGVYSPTNRHYYYRTKINEGGENQVLFDMHSPMMRSELETSMNFEHIENARSKSERERRVRDSGISCRSVLFELSSIRPFRSFPIDIMPLFYTVRNHLLEPHLHSDLNDAFIFPSELIKQMDDELTGYTSGISGQIAPSPQPISKFKQWKGAEHREFTLSYLLVLFDGHFPREYLEGLKQFVHLVDMCHRPSLSTQDVEKIGELAKTFVTFYERCYFRYCRSRVNLCKYVVHLLLHLEESVRYCGPLICNTKFWVEKWIGWTVERCNARNRAGAAMSNSAVSFESYKMFYKKRAHGDTSEYDRLASEGGCQLVGSIQIRKIAGMEQSEYRFRKLIADYISRKFDWIQANDAKAVASRLSGYEAATRLRFLSGSAVQTVVLQSAAGTARPSCFVAVEMESSSTEYDVYYGKVLDLVRFEMGDMQTGNERLRNLTFNVAVISWASGLRLGDQGQVYRRGVVNNAFGEVTMEDSTIIKRLVGLVEHVSVVKKRPRNSARIIERKEKRVYFADPCNISDGLFNQDASADGVSRTLRGFDL